MERTFVAEVKSGLAAADFKIANTEFDRRKGFPQVLVSYGGLDRERSREGERVPRAEIRAAVGYVLDANEDVHELVEDTAIKLFDALTEIPTVLAFDYTGVARFEPFDGTEAQYFGLIFIVERSGGVPRG